MKPLTSSRYWQIRKVVQDADLEVLLQHKAVQVPEIYKLDRFVIILVIPLLLQLLYVL